VAINPNGLSIYIKKDEDSYHGYFLLDHLDSLFSMILLCSDLPVLTPAFFRAVNVCVMVRFADWLAWF